MEGKTKVYIFAETSGLRVDARNSLTAALKKQKIATEEKLSRKSTELATFIKNQDIIVVYKNKSGGMQESTLNASITELFPIIAFDKKISEKLTEQKFYTEIQKSYDPKSKVFLGTNDNKQGKKFIDAGLPPSICLLTVSTNFFIVASEFVLYILSSSGKNSFAFFALAPVGNMSNIFSI